MRRTPTASCWTRSGAPRRRSPPSSASSAAARCCKDVGCLECGLKRGYESIIFGDHLLGWAYAFVASPPVDDDALALDEVERVGPGGNQLAPPSTSKHFRQIGQSDFFDTTCHDAWEAGGSRTLLDRLKARSSELRSAPRAFELTDDVKAGLDRILADVEACRLGAEQTVVPGGPGRPALPGPRRLSRRLLPRDRSGPAPGPCRCSRRRARAHRRH